MNFVTTNIRLSEEDYLRLKTEAAKSRKSLSAIIREKLSQNQTNTSSEKLLQSLDTLAKKQSKKLKGFNSLKALREMRDNAKW